MDYTKVKTLAANYNEVIEYQAKRIEELTTALTIVRNYPDFDETTPIGTMIDEVLKEDHSPLINFLHRVKTYE